MATVIHTWVTRAFCPSCETYFWTNPGSGSVLCACGASHIHENVILSGDAVVDTAAFKAAVAHELDIDIADLSLRTE
jgi:hypothetical protein